MKELSIEEKAKRYDEAIEKAKEMIKSMTNIGGVANVADIQYLFTELKESEDEKTKRLLHTIANKMSQHLRDIFTEEEFQFFDAWSNAWLEKQGEQKPAWSEEDERILREMITIFGLENFEGYNIGKNNEDALKFLNSLKERYTWKPSDEQMAALNDINLTGSISYVGQGQELISLYKDLKKLMDE